MSERDDASGTPWPHSRREAEVQDIVTTLRTYGVLTRVRLAERCGSSRWSEPAFAQALAQAVSAGRVRPLGDDFYEAIEPEPEG